MKKSLLVLLLGLGLAACGGGGGGDVTSPSAANQMPNVAGTYTGPVSWTVDGAPFYPLTMQLNVAQAGSQLTISGSFTVNGRTVPITAMTGNINATGYFTPTSGGAMGTYDASCGYITNIDGSLTFSGRNAQYVERDSTSYCGAWVFSGTLAR
jgi:hypothetical protein